MGPEEPIDPPQGEGADDTGAPSIEDAPEDSAAPDDLATSAAPELPAAPTAPRRSQLKRRYRRRRLVPILTTTVLVIAVVVGIGTTRALRPAPASSQQTISPTPGSTTSDMGATEGSMAPGPVDDTMVPASVETTTTVPPTTAPPTTAAALPVDPLGPQSPVAPLALQDGGAPVVARIATADPVIFVTIDDGTVRDPRVLDFLRTTGMPVTMFLNAAPVREDPAYFDAIRQLGNTVNTHTLNHPKLPTLPPEAQHNEICGMADLIRTTYGTDGGLFRPPFGQWNAGVRQQATSCGQRATVSWMGTIDGGQLHLQEPTLKAGDIILTHFREDLYDNLVTIQRVAAESGLRIARLDPYLPKG